MDLFSPKLIKAALLAKGIVIRDIIFDHDKQAVCLLGTQHGGPTYQEIPYKEFRAMFCTTSPGPSSPDPENPA